MPKKLYFYLCCCLFCLCLVQCNGPERKISQEQIFNINVLLKINDYQITENEFLAQIRALDRNDDKITERINSVFDSYFVNYFFAREAIKKGYEERLINDADWNHIKEDYFKKTIINKKIQNHYLNSSFKISEAFYNPDKCYWQMYSDEDTKLQQSLDSINYNNNLIENFDLSEIEIPDIVCVIRNDTITFKKFSELIVQNPAYVPFCFGKDIMTRIEAVRILALQYKYKSELNEVYEIKNREQQLITKIIASVQDNKQKKSELIYRLKKLDQLYPNHTLTQHLLIEAKNQDFRPDIKKVSLRYKIENPPKLDHLDFAYNQSLINNMRIPYFYLSFIIAKTNNWQITVADYLHELEKLTNETKDALSLLENKVKFLHYLKNNYRTDFSNAVNLKINYSLLENIHELGKPEAIKIIPPDSIKIIAKQDSFSLLSTELKTSISEMPWSMKKKFINPDTKITALKMYIREKYLISKFEQYGEIDNNNDLIAKRYNYLASRFIANELLGENEAYNFSSFLTMKTPIVKDLVKYKVNQLITTYKTNTEYSINYVLLNDYNYLPNSYNLSIRQFSLNLSDDLNKKWNQMDIGRTSQKGTTFCLVNNFIIETAGYDIGDNKDAFHFYYSEQLGDGGMIVKVNHIKNTHRWAKAGLMVRQSLAPESKNIFIGLTQGKDLVITERTANSINTNEVTNFPLRIPLFIKIMRTGNRFTTYHSDKGFLWEKICTINLNMPDKVYIGMAVSSHKENIVGRAHFSNLSLIDP